MARTRDGIQTPLPPSPMGLLLGLIVLGGGIAASILASPCAGVPVAVIGALMLLNQVNGKRRVRVTFSKLLVEDERLVMGFLIGPSKQRVAWTDYGGAAIDSGQLVVKDKRGGELKVGAGVDEAILTELIGRIEEAVERHDKEGEL